MLTILSGCRTYGGDMLASRNTTVEYYRVFDIKTDAAPQVVAKAASEGINRNLKDAVVTTPPDVQVTDLPGHFKIADPTSVAPGSPAEKGPTCDGAAWTAKASPRVRGGDNMNVVACLFPYKSGYHLDMYTVFTKPEGGWLYWPRRLGGTIFGTPEKFTEKTMMDLVRAIREGTNAQVALVEAKPNLAGTPWLESDKGTSAQAPAKAAAPASTGAAAEAGAAPSSTGASAGTASAQAVPTPGEAR